MRIRYDAAAMARRKGRSKAAALAPIEATQALQSELKAIIRRIVAAWAAEVSKSIVPAYGGARDQLVRDDATDLLRAALGAAGDALSSLVLSVTPDLRDWVVRVETWHRRRFASTLLAALGIDISAQVGESDVRTEIELIVERNVALIKGLSDDIRKQVEREVYDALLNQVSRADLAKRLAERMDVGRSRADFIARDQTQKLAAELDRIRQEQAGIDRYKWRHSGKAHPRPEHVARDGKIFLWSKPPYDGHPGTQPNCGCKAQAYVSLD